MTETITRRKYTSHKIIFQLHRYDAVVYEVFNKIIIEKYQERSENELKQRVDLERDIALKMICL